MMLTNKRGVSGVVTAVLLILLVIAAIGILWVVFQNFVKEGIAPLEGSADCLTTTFDIDNVVNADDIQINITRTIGTSEITDFRIIVDGTLDTSTQILTSFGIGERQKLVVGTPTALVAGQKVEIAAVFGENICASIASAIVQ